MPQLQHWCIELWQTTSSQAVSQQAVAEQLCLAGSVLSSYPAAAVNVLQLPPVHCDYTVVTERLHTAAASLMYKGHACVPLSPHWSSPHACVDLNEPCPPAGVLALYMEHTHVETKRLQAANTTWQLKTP